MKYYSLTFLIQTSLILLTIQSRTNSSLQSELRKIQNQINKLQSTSYILSSINRHNRHACKEQDDQSALGAQAMGTMKSIAYQQLDVSKQMQNYCELGTSRNNKYFVFQTPRSAYIGINVVQSVGKDMVSKVNRKMFHFYNSQCHLISVIQNTAVSQIYCDRGLCDDGNVVLLTQDHNLIICSQLRNFTQCSIFASISNSIKGIPVGGTVRNKGSGQFQVYIADSVGEIIVFDSQGKQRLSVSMEADSKIQHFVQMHPYPLIVSNKGWIYSFQNTKYTISLTKCPYLFHKIKRVFISHPYNSILYAISEQMITKLEVKSQSKVCEVIMKIQPKNKIQSLHIKSEVQNKQVAQYQGILYIGNTIIDFHKKSVMEFKSCGSETAFNFQMMKNNYRKGFFTLHCCQQTGDEIEQEENKQKCSIVVFKSQNQQQTSSKNNTIIMIVILFFIMLMVFFFLKSNSPNLDYDEQLRYNHNINYKNQVQQFLKSKAEKHPKSSIKSPEKQKQPSGKNVVEKQSKDHLKKKEK